MIRMTGVAMMAGSLGVGLQLAFFFWMYGIQGLEAAAVAQSVFGSNMGQSIVSAGVPEQILGTGVQWAIAVLSALVYAMVGGLLPYLFSLPMSFGAMYGAAVYLFSNYVLPVWIDPAFQAPPLSGKLADLGVSAVLMGIPMVYSTKMMMGR